MPELPEVETVKRELTQAIVGKKIDGVIINNAKVIRQNNPKDFLEGLKGLSVKGVLRKGKLLIIELSNGKALAIHLKMTGQLVYPGDGLKSRVSFKFSDGKFMDFRDQRLFGELCLVSNWKDLKFVKALGPEPFDLTQDKFRQMLLEKNSKIKTLLLDQSFVSGIGNLYAAEALFRAKIHPERKASSLAEKEASALLKEIKDTLSEAIKYKGSSIDQYVQLDGQRGEYVKFHKVYGRQGKPCLICKMPIKRISLGGRGTYFCPRCQK
ncbi:MAG: DNA-formamidopyrimidine glycosylase [Candidatus Omnitrophica bacterium]|nr:DNA-formamidopyrimidine glycosylase [Candidatus Omnitrophota bacterium]